MSTNQERSAGLPIRRNLTLAYIFSLIIAILMAAASIAGLLYPAVIYPKDELLQSFMPNDVVNLFIGAPILLGSMWLARRGQLIGLLFWPGALFYVLYNYIAYVFGMPSSVLFLLYLAMVTLSAYTLIGLVAGIDGTAVRQTVPCSVRGVYSVQTRFFLARTGRGRSGDRGFQVREGARDLPVGKGRVALRGPDLF